MPIQSVYFIFFAYSVSQGCANQERDTISLLRRSSSTGNDNNRSVKAKGLSTFLRLDTESFVERELISNDFRMWNELLNDGVGSLTGAPTRSPVVTPLPPTAMTEYPTFRPTPRPTFRPTPRPTRAPVPQATPRPTRIPTLRPSPRPTRAPVPQATPRPTRIPTLRPSPRPTPQPSLSPVRQPTRVPTAIPTQSPEDCSEDGICNENCSVIDPDPDCPPNPSPSPQCEPVVSNFDLGDEGWTITGDAQGGLTDPSYSTEGGNPGGHIFAIDDVTGAIWRFRAPQKFYGDFSGAYGYNLRFDLRQSTSTDQFESRDVIIEGGGSLIWIETLDNPGIEWTSYTIPLVEGAGWQMNNDDEATEQDIRNVLRSIEDLQIRGEYRTGDDTGRLDNVVLESVCAPSVAPTSAPASLDDLFLVNANEDTIIQPLINGQIIELESFPGDIAFSVLADAGNSGTTAVEWVLTNAETGEVLFSFSDSSAPFTLGGEIGGNILPVMELSSPGRYSITATPVNSNGMVGTPLSRVFSVVDLFQGGSGTNRGTEFWIAELPNLEELPVDDPGDFGIVVVNTGQRPAEVEIIHIESQTVETITIPVGGAETLQFPRRGVASSGVTSTPTYRIISDTEVVVYAFSPLNDVRSNDATLVLPTASLGTTYRVLAYQSPTENFVGTIYAVVATQVNTRVQVFDLDGNLVDDVTIDAGETLQRIEQFDLSGYQIVASNPVAVFSGSRCTAAGSSTEYCDILYEQVLPEQAVGSTYLSCPSLTRPFGCNRNSCSFDIFRYMATEGNVSIEYAGNNDVLGEGEVVEYSSNEPHVVTASGPIYAWQIFVSYSSGPNAPVTGDPSIVQIPPVEQFQFEYTVYTPGTFSNNFFHTMAPNGMTLTIDGASQTVDCTDDVAGTIDGINYCCQAIAVDQGVHEVVGSQAFGIYATGFDDFSSFGYSGGTGVQAISSGCVSGGPYMASACETPVRTRMNGAVECSDGSTPLVFWSTPDITLGFENVSDLTTTVTVNAFGSFVVCLDVICGESIQQCCSTIDVMQMGADGSSCQ